MSPSASPSASPSLSPSPGIYGYGVPLSLDQWKGMYVVKWIALTSEAAGGNVGMPFACPTYPIKSVQVLGTFGASGNCVIEGSNMPDKDTAVYATMHNLAGTELILNDATVRGVQENTYWVRPRVTGGDGTTDVDVYLLCVTER